MGAKGKSPQFLTLIEKQNLSSGSTYEYAVLVLGLVTAGSAGVSAPPLGMFVLTLWPMTQSSSPFSRYTNL